MDFLAVKQSILAATEGDDHRELIANVLDAAPGVGDFQSWDTGGGLTADVAVVAIDGAQYAVVLTDNDGCSPAEDSDWLCGVYYGPWIGDDDSALVIVSNQAGRVA